MKKTSKRRSLCVSLLPDEKPLRGVKLPGRRPRSARYVGWVSWSWGPAHSRTDLLFLSLDSHRKHWLLWLEWDDEDGFESGVRAYTPCGDTSAFDASRTLVQCWYRREEKEYSDIEGPWMEVGPGILSRDDFATLAKKIWPASEIALAEAETPEREVDADVRSTKNELFGYHLLDETDLVSVGLRAAANLGALSTEIVQSNENFVVVEATVSRDIWEQNHFLPADFGRIQTYLRGDPFFKVVVTRWPDDGIRFSYFWRDLPITGYIVPNRLRPSE